jgi:hypothetical protein
MQYWATQCLDDAGYFREILEKLANQKKALFGKKNVMTIT